MANYVHTYVVTVVQYVNESTPRHILRGSATSVIDKLRGRYHWGSK